MQKVERTHNHCHNNRCSLDNYQRDEVGHGDVSKSVEPASPTSWDLSTYSAYDTTHDGGFLDVFINITSLEKL